MGPGCDTDDSGLLATLALRLAEAWLQWTKANTESGSPMAADADSPDLMMAKRLIDHLKFHGFQFDLAAPGVDGPLVGHRVTDDWLDVIHIEGFSRDCFAWRKRRSSLILPGEGLVERRTQGHALTVLNEVLSWSLGTHPTTGQVPR